MNEPSEAVRPPDVSAWADQLRQYATHFAMRDWEYTRDLRGMRHIRYADDFRGYHAPHRRLTRAIRHLLGPQDTFSKAVGNSGLRWRWLLATRALGTETNLPDGRLDGGNVMVLWEETGEYLQYVQPSVGALLADLMDAHPDLPEVVAIAAEMKRINDNYASRIRSSEAGEDR